MHNFQIIIAYDGTGYSGWQRQKNGVTIQGMLEDKLSTITREAIVVNGAGRTDAGVHALAMSANFLTNSSMTADSFQRALNSMLPTAVRILSVNEAAPDFHARYDTSGKSYCYHFFTGTVQQPSERLYRSHVPCPFADNLETVRRCLQSLVGSHDFSSFEATGSRDLTKTKGRGAVRTLFQAECTGRDQYYSFLFTGDGFLRHMVRNLAGTLLLAGNGRMNYAEFRAVMRGRDRQLAGPTAPAHGLFLKKVHYAPIS